MNGGFSRLSMVVIAAVLVLCVSAFGRAEEPPAPGQSAGVVVEAVTRGYSGARGGIEPGDTILGWRRELVSGTGSEAAAGRVVSPLQIGLVEVEEAPRGAFFLEIERRGASLELEIPPGLWKLELRPALEPGDLEEYEEARRELDSGGHDRALETLLQLSERLRASSPSASVWCLLKAAEIEMGRKQFDAAAGWIDLGVQLLVDQGLRAEAAVLKLELVRATVNARKPALALEVLPVGEALARREPGSELLLGRFLHFKGQALALTGHLTEAEQIFREALSLRTAVAPDSVWVGRSKGDIGSVLMQSGRTREAETSLLEALEIEERLVPNSISAAVTSGNLAGVAFYRGAYADALRFAKRNLEIVRERDPGSVKEAIALGNLGALEAMLGDLESAERHLREAVTIKRERADPESRTLAVALATLGHALLLKGDLDEAELLLQESVEIKKIAVGDSVTTAASLSSIGDVQVARQQWRGAQALYEESLRMLEENAPGGLQEASVRQNLGEALLASESIDEAVLQLRAALEIRRALAPASDLVAESCFWLGRAHRTQGDSAAAEIEYQCAVEALDSQVGKIGSSDLVLARFAEKYAPFYAEFVDLLNEQGRFEEAFRILERSRARNFKALLSERRFRFSAELPEELADRRTALLGRYDGATKKLSRLVAHSEDLEEAQAERAEIRERIEALQEEIREGHPRVSLIDAPPPPSWDESAGRLDPGTVVLAFSVGRWRSHVFVASREAGVRAAEIAAGEEELLGLVDDFVKAVEEAGPSATGQRRWASLKRTGSALYDLLIAPVEARVAAGARILILPDGPLYRLPFAALVRRADTEDEEFFVEWKALHLATSVSSLLELESVLDRGTGRSAVFADPDYGTGETARSLFVAERAGLSLTALPASRSEAEAVAKRMGESPIVRFGADASEEAAKALSNHRYVHFASHALVDDRFPLDSGLVLARPTETALGSENGLLQVWEIFEFMRLRAELVVLSACDTGTGRAMGGEGVIGLTRAFHYAGARSVLATLWQIRDGSATDLLTGFYDGLAAGADRVEALQAAQKRLISRGREGETSRSVLPSTWATFQLYGSNS